MSLKSAIAALVPQVLLSQYGRLKHARIHDQRKLHQLWESIHLRRLLSHLEVDCVFDVGANFGQYAQMLRKAAGYRGLIVSFEPMPEAAAALRAIAAGDPLWVVEELAISRTEGEQVFHVMHSHQFSSLSTPRHDETPLFQVQNQVRERVNVRTENLGTTFERLERQHGFRRPFLKLDTQGFDVEIVRAALQVMPRFAGLQSELAVRRLYDDSVDFREAISLYESCGFTLSAIVPNNEGHFPQLIETDCIMVREDLIAC